MVDKITSTFYFFYEMHGLASQLASDQYNLINSWDLQFQTYIKLTIYNIYSLRYDYSSYVAGKFNIVW